jgi:hypothetical protein
VVLVGESKRILLQGRRIAIRAGYKYSQVTVFVDRGLGVHGIPDQASHLLDRRFLFDAGHSMCPTSHYLRLAQSPEGADVYSVFAENPENGSRTKLNDLFELSNDRRRQGGVVALPYALNVSWVGDSVEARYNIRALLSNQARKGGASFVSAEFEPEFDISNEQQRTRQFFLINQVGYFGLWLAARLADGHDRREARHSTHRVAS